MKGIQIRTLVEIGAHFGLDTKEFREMHPSARILCFEPDPRNIAIIQKLGHDKICELYPMAVSDTNEPMDFYISSGKYPVESASPVLQVNDWSCSSSLKKPTGHLEAFEWITFPEKIQVKCCRLDDFQPLRGQIIDFMWVDVQGAEDLVFSGAEETLQNTRYVYTEYSNDELYEGQLNLVELLKLFGPSWQILYDYGGDILLSNKRFNYYNEIRYLEEVLE